MTMAYDLLLRRLTPEHYGRGERPACLPPDDAGSRGASSLGWNAAIVALLIVGVAARERFSRDRKIVRAARQNNPHTTQEMPAVSMSEMVYGRDE
jgi:hypothetical protein